MGEHETILQKDSEARDRIVSDIETNFFVEAGAGSGKTSMLVKRMAAMVESGIPITKICAITFTKAAAGEFYDRFQKCLIERSKPGTSPETPADEESAGQLPKPSEETRKRCAEALKNIDLCFMGTIDSFCNMVLSEHPSEAGIPSDAGTVEDLDAAAIYKQYYVKICGGEYGEELAALARQFRRLHRSAEEVFVQGISLLMDHRNAAFCIDPARAKDGAGNAGKPGLPQHDIEQFQKEQEEIAGAIGYLMQNPGLKYEKEQKSKAAWEQIADAFQNIRGSLDGHFPNVLYGLNMLKNIRVLPEAAKDNTGDARARYLQSVFTPGGKQGKWLEFAPMKENGLYSRLQRFRYSCSMDFLQKCVPVIANAMKEKGALSYFDYLYYLCDTLKRDAAQEGKLIRYISEKHSYFLIDEFQDTNPMQAELFFYLAAEKPVPQWRECVPKPGSLFIVGDPKQSIYRFRGADVASFLKVETIFADLQKRGKGGAILQLTRNFRSSRSLCEYFNKTFTNKPFTEMLRAETEAQSSFAAIPLPEAMESPCPEKPEHLLDGVYSYKSYTGKKDPQKKQPSDPEKIASIIKGLVDGGRIQAGECGGTRPIRYSDFLVISYGKKTLGPILGELAAQEIPAKAEGTVLFSENEALCALYQIYAAIADPSDKLALYAALTGRLIALPEKALLEYRSCGGNLSLLSDFDTENCQNEAAVRVAQEIARLKELHKSALRLSPAALFARIMDDIQLFRVLEAENLELVYYALELLRNAENNGQAASLKDGRAFLQKLVSGASEEERSLRLDEAGDCVHIANLHKVKGLEAPIVILAGAANYPPSPSLRVVQDDESPTGYKGYVFSLESGRDGNGRSRVFFSSADFPKEQEAEKEALEAEGLRLLYVAATRARNALILCDRIVLRADKSERSNTKWKPLLEDGLPEIDMFLAGIEKQGERQGKDGSGERAGKRMEGEAGEDAADLYERAERSCVLRNRSAEGASFHVENPSRLRLVSKLAEKEETEDAPPETEAPLEEAAAGEAESGESTGGENAKNKRFPALLGTMTHKLLEMLVSARKQIDAERAAEEILNEYCTPEMAGYEKELKETLQRVAACMQGGGYAQTNGLPKDLLSVLRSAEEVYCEVPFCYAEETEEGQTIWNGIMDLVYYAEGKWHIVDYKTNADGSDLDRKYQAQLAAYKKALLSILGAEADAATYHIDV